MNLIQKLQSIIDAANNTTGFSDSDVTQCVESLIAGYGEQQEAKTYGTYIPYTYGQVGLSGTLVVEEEFPTTQAE